MYKSLLTIILTVFFSCLIHTQTNIVSIAGRNELNGKIPSSNVPFFSYNGLFDSLIEDVADRPEGSGIHLIWAPRWADTINFVRSIQGYYQWRHTEPRPGVYDWSELHSDLARAKQLNKPILLQLNMPAPGWISDSVAILGTSRNGPAPQYWDERYLRLYQRVLKQFAAEIHADANRSMVIGVRVQPCTFNTEIENFVPSEFTESIKEEDYSTWKSFPKGYSALNPSFKAKRTDIKPGTSETYTQQYLRSVNSCFALYFHAIGVKTFWRTLLNKRNFPASYTDSLFSNEYSAGLDTRCEIPKAGGMRARFLLIEQRAKQEGKEFMWEDSKHGWPGHDWKTDMYWRNLYRLDAGVCYLGIYGAHMEYKESFGFVNKYAGYADKPIKAPGAWIAYHSSDVKKDNLGYFITHVNKYESKVLFDVSDDYHSAFARSSDIGFKNKLDTAFYETIKGKPVKISVTWLDNRARFEIEGFSGTYGDNTGKYQTMSFSGILAKPEINVKVLSGELVMHMLEIAK